MRRTGIFSEPCIDIGPAGDSVERGLAALRQLYLNRTTTDPDTSRMPYDGSWRAERVERLAQATVQLGEVSREIGKQLLERAQGPDVAPIPGRDNLRIFARRDRPIETVQSPASIYMETNATTQGGLPDIGDTSEGIVSILPMTAADRRVDDDVPAANIDELSICEAAAVFLRTDQSDKAALSGKSEVRVVIGQRVVSYEPTGIDAGIVGDLTSF